ncbi:envelope protein [Operophtera brumata]|uniref:Envelope protein n=1 Tax=Operophtera brumata TaxID=104452 RepID=A0A0L7KU11_OPEBR|nr:envelope protein [Operophtera brumata]
MDSTTCFNTLQPLDSLYKDILRDFDSISHLVSNHPSKRSAWFSGVGVVFKHIFGTLDEDDAKSYNNAIQKLSNTDTKLAKLNDVVDKVTASLNNVFNSALNVLQSSLLTLSFKVEDFLNSILFVRSNTIHPSILTPHQLYKDIVSNLKIVPKYRDFPVNLDLSNIHIIMNTADLVCYYLDGKFVFVIKIPLVDALEYNLYKNIPLPTPHVTGNPNSFAMILPSEEYLALSKDKSLFVLLNNLKSCKITFVRNYVCEVADVSTVSGNPSCEIEIITKATTSLPENCQFRFVHGNIDIWHKLNNEKWIFVQSKPTKISIECNNNIKTSEIIISGTVYFCKKNKYSKKLFLKSDKTEETNDSDIELKSNQPRLRIE